MSRKPPLIPRQGSRPEEYFGLRKGEYRWGPPPLAERRLSRGRPRRDARFSPARKIALRFLASLFLPRLGYNSKKPCPLRQKQALLGQPRYAFACITKQAPSLAARDQAKYSSSYSYHNSSFVPANRMDEWVPRRTERSEGRDNFREIWILRKRGI